MLIKFILSKQFYLPIIYIVFGFVLYFIISNLINKLNSIKNKHINRKKQNTIISLFKTIVKVLIMVIVAIMVLGVYGVNTTGILASLSVVGVVIGLAFQDVLKNLLAGITIIFDDHYAIGDNVKINGFQGDVISLGLQTTKIKAYTGEVFIIGNSSITEIINYSLNASKLILDIPVSYDTDLDKLENVLEKMIDKIKKIDNVLGNVEILGLDEFSSSCLKYKIALDCNAMTHFGVKRKILQLIKKEFDKNKIEIPFDQLTIHLKGRE